MAEQRTYERGGPSSPAYTGEVSLRDLYLILKKSIGWIAAAALLAGVLVFLFLGIRPDTYVGESTTLVTPIVARPTLNIGEEELTIAGGGSIPFNTYQALAKSRQVMERVISEVPAYDDTLLALDRAMSLELLVGPAQDTQSGALAVIHKVTDQSPELAAELANAWAHATLDVVRLMLLDDLAPVREATEAALTTAESGLLEAETELRAFQATNQVSQLSGELAGATEYLVGVDLRLRSLNSAITLEETRLEQLRAHFEEELNVLTTRDPTSLAFLSGMTLNEANDHLNQQLENARREYSSSREALRQFDQQYNLELLRQRESSLAETIAADHQTLATLSRSLELANSTLEWQLAELAEQPERLTLTRSLLDDPLLLENLRTQDGVVDLSTISAANVQFEQLNPHHTQLLSDTLGTELSINQMEARFDVVSASVEELTMRMDELRAQRLAAESERMQLSLANTEAQAVYDALAAQIVPLTLAASRPDAGDREMRQTSSTLESLRDSIRSSEAELVRLNTEVNIVRSNQAELEQRVVELRTQIADINLDQRNLDRVVSQRREAFASVSQLQPLMAFFGELAPGNARMMNPAAPPEAPVGNSRLLSTIIAIVVVGLLGTVLAFLREAVRDPRDYTPARAGQGEPAAAD